LLKGFVLFDGISRFRKKSGIGIRASSRHTQSPL
jgi:hypothetical protein